MVFRASANDENPLNPEQSKGGPRVKRSIDTKQHRIRANAGEIVGFNNENDEPLTPIGISPEMIERQLRNLGTGEDLDYVQVEGGPMRGAGASNTFAIRADAEFGSTPGADGVVTSMTRGSQSSELCKECHKPTTPRNSSVVGDNERSHYSCKGFNSGREPGNPVRR
jgi:hypothetical protein